MGQPLTRQQIIHDIREKRRLFDLLMCQGFGIPTTHPCYPVTLPRVPGQRFYVLRVDDQDEAYYTRVLGWHPVARMPEPPWKCVDFLVNVEMEE